MAIADYLDKSVSSPRLLIQLSIGQLNYQWINCGAGIWKLNYNAIYPEVISWLLPSSVFYLQHFGQIGSVRAGATLLTAVASLAAVTNAQDVYYYDGDATLYISLANFDNPALHLITIGVTFGYSFSTFTPVNSIISYDGRLKGDPTVAISRDILFFGKLQYSVGSFTLINTDGYFDRMGENYNVYGNYIRILFGYDDLPLADYVQLTVGVIENLTLTETEAKFTIGDPRKTLAKSITYTCTNKNALSVIEELLLDEYKIPYTSDYFDVTAWNAAKAVAPNVTIDIAPGKGIEDTEVNDIIKNICTSLLGLFITDGTGKYTWKYISATGEMKATLHEYELRNVTHSISYDPTEIMSSTKIGYNKNWEETYVSPYTWLYDTTREVDSFNKYHAYNQKEIFTLLTNLTDAQKLSTDFLNYFEDIHGVFSVIVPMKYYYLLVGDLVNVTINRTKSTMLGIKKCEVLGIKYSLASAKITLTFRIIKEAVITNFTAIGIYSDSNTATVVIAIIHNFIANDIYSDSGVEQPIMKLVHTLAATDICSNSSVGTPAAVHYFVFALVQDLSADTGLSLALDGTVALAGTTTGEIYRSTNSGASWALAQDLGSFFLFGVALKGTVALAGTTTGEIYRSTNSGASWSLAQDLGSSAIISLVFDGTTALAGCADGTIYRSTNSGASWSLAQDLGSSAIESLVFDGTTALAGCADGTIYRSTNSGASWSLAQNIGAGVIFSLALDGAIALAGMQNGAVWRSINSGATWALAQDLGSYAIYAITLDGVSALVGLADGEIWRSLNSGVSWVTLQDITSGAAAINTLVVDGTNALAIVENAEIWRAHA